ncbi:hypothetical protein V6U90_29810 [Micromonospora sp. CPCC 206060]|uniref:hypothetical protein n=1 Tax=Micromonospora sp. CPCC 206060 TaxID=3122406 RepID=UPI002FF034CC
MEELPRTDPPRRIPGKAAPRPRAAKPTFTPPPDAGQPENDGNDGNDGPGRGSPEAGGVGTPVPATRAPRARRPKADAAPPVLFQPPAEVTTPAAGDPEHIQDALVGDPPARGRKRSTAAKRPAPARKVTPPRRDGPEQAQQENAEQPQGRTAPLGTPARTNGLHTPTTAQLLEHPRHAPELLACTAVATMGPYARSWADRMRTIYPAADADGLARLAVRRYRRLAAVGGATSALAGLLAPLAELVTVACTQAGLVLHLAAAHGRDPVHPDRAVELLVLTRVHPDAAVARAALGEVRAVLAESLTAPDGTPVAGDDATGPAQRPAGVGPRLVTLLGAQAGGWLAVRLVARWLPGMAVLAAAAGDSAAMERLAARAVAFYRRPPVAGG